MDSVELQVDTTGWENLLKALPAKVAGRKLHTAFDCAGVIMADAIAEEAPERTDTPTPDSTALPPGILKADISWQVQQKKTMDARVKVGPTSIAGRQTWWVENGFDHKSKNGTFHTDANPFMARGFERSIGHATNAFLDSLQASLEQDDDGISGTGTSGEL